MNEDNTSQLLPVDRELGGGVEETKKPEKPDEAEREKTHLLKNPQVQLFLKYFYDKTEKETFGNRVKSYLKAYNLDPAEKYKSAGTLSSRLLKKVGKSAREYLEESGFGLEKMLELNVIKAIQTDNAKYLEMLYEMGEYKKDPKAAGPTNQFNILNVNQAQADDFSQKLLKFLEGS